MILFKKILTDRVAREESRRGIEQCQKLVQKLTEYDYLVRETRLELGVVGKEERYSQLMITAIDFLKDSRHYIHSYRLILIKNGKLCTLHASDELFQNLSIHYRDGSKENLDEELDSILAQASQQTL